MKIRTDFVTNSSSSSFVLAFDTQEDIDEFHSRCDFMNYEEFDKLITNIASDTLYISNEKNESLDVKEIYCELIKNNAPIDVRLAVSILVNSKKILKPYESLYIPLYNPLNEDGIETEYLGWEGIDNDNWSVAIWDAAENRDKTIAINNIHDFIISDFTYDLIQKRIPYVHDEDFKEHNRKVVEFRESEEYKKLVDEFLASSEYEEMKKRIENAKLVINGTIWDTSGGVLQWSIRNGFIENNFGDYSLIVWNVG